MRLRPAASEHDNDRWLLCAACGGFIAQGSARIEVSGAHEHSFVNPAGLIFRVRCFSEAGGLLPAGEESDHWTWFSGFRWQAGLCRRCARHVGWSYRNESSRFVALIKDRVIERPAPRGS